MKGDGRPERVLRGGGGGGGGRRRDKSVQWPPCDMHVKCTVLSGFIIFFAKGAQTT